MFNGGQLETRNSNKAKVKRYVNEEKGAGCGGKEGMSTRDTSGLHRRHQDPHWHWKKQHQ